MKKFIFFTFFLVFLVINFSYGWGVSYSDNYFELNQGQETNFSVRIVNMDNENATIAFDFDDNNNLVQSVNRESPLFVPAGTRGFPDPNRVELITTLKLDENATEPYYYVVINFREVVEGGTGIGMQEARAVRITINNTMVPEHVEEVVEEHPQDYSQEVLILSLVILTIFGFLISKTILDYKKNKEEEQKKRTKKDKKLKKEVLKSVILFLVILSFLAISQVSLVFADSPSEGTPATVTIGERESSLTIVQIESFTVGDEVLFYASYRGNNYPITTATCLLGVGGNTHTMDYSLSGERYEKKLIFNTVGDYTYTISCSELYHKPKSQASSFKVSPKPSRISRPTYPTPEPQNLTDYIQESFFIEKFEEIVVIINLTEKLQDPRVSISDECLLAIREEYVYYNCFSVEPLYDNNYTKKVTLIFGVEIDWLQQEDVNMSTVSLEKDGDFIETEFLEESGDFMFFISTFDSFSNFRVYAKRNVYPKVDYWDMLKEIEDYYYRPRHISEIEDVLKLYYGKFDGTGTTTTYKFDEHLLDTNRIVVLLLLSLFTILIVSKRRRDKNEKK